MKIRFPIKCFLFLTSSYLSRRLPKYFLVDIWLLIYVDIGVSFYIYLIKYVIFIFLLYGLVNNTLTCYVNPGLHDVL